MVDARIVWTAKGACDACQRPVARRVEGAGLWDVDCRVCGARSRLLSERIMLSPEGPIPAEAVALPHVPDQDPATTPLGLPKAARRAKPPREKPRAIIPRLERRRRNLWAAPTLAFAFFILIFGAFVAFGPTPAALELASGEATVEVILEGLSPEVLPLEVRLLHEGVLLATDTAEHAPANGSSIALLESTAPPAMLELRVLHDGRVLLEERIDASACAQGVLRVVLGPSQERGIVLREATCLSA